MASMRRVYLKAVYIFLYISLGPCIYGLDLKSAEEQVLAHSFSQKASQANIRATHENLIQKYGEILPSVDARLELQHREYPQSRILVKQNIPYTPQWFQERKVLQLSENISTKKLKLDRQTLLNQVRKLYFRIQFLEKQNNLALESFKLIEQFEKQSENRYRQGFISLEESQRAKLQRLNLEQNWEQIKIEISSARKQLALYLGSNGGTLKLETPLQPGDNFLKVTEAELRLYAEKESSESVNILKISKESAQIQAEVAKYRYFPVISAEARFPFDDFGKQREDPVYLASLSWNLFAGGSDRSEQRRLWEIFTQSDFNLKDAKLNLSNDLEDTLSSLLVARATYKSQTEGLKMWEKLVASSQKRFQQGNMSSKDLSDDINSYLTYATNYYNTSYDVLSNLSQFCFLIGKEELFHQYLL